MRSTGRGRGRGLLGRAVLPGWWPGAGQGPGGGEGRGARGRAGGCEDRQGSTWKPYTARRVGFVGKDGTPFSSMPEKKRKFLEENNQNSDARESEPRWRLCSEERRMLQEEEGRVGGGRGAGGRAERTSRGLGVRWRVGCGVFRGNKQILPLLVQ